MSKPQVVFFGTGPVAAKSLELLLSNFNVEAVITKPKPAHHRGSFPVAEVASKNKLTIHEVTDKKSLSGLFERTKFKSRVGILIDFGIIVRKDVIDSFEKGIVNSHFSLLPEWRGADPISFSILSGQKETGVSLMLINEKMDEGLLLSQSPVRVDDSDTTDILTAKLIAESDESLKSVLKLWLNDEISPAKQEDVTIAMSSTPTYSRKLTKEDGLLDFTKPAEQLEREIRAYLQWPKSRTKLNDLDIIVTKAHVVDLLGAPGSIEVGKNELIIFTDRQALSLDEVQPSGKPAMPITAFLAGYRNRL